MLIISRKQALTLGGEDYIVLPRDEYERLARLAKAAELPPLPETDAKGNYPAIEFMRASMARDVIRDRARLGLSQAELARRAGIPSASKPSTGSKAAACSLRSRPSKRSTGR